MTTTDPAASPPTHVSQLVDVADAAQLLKLAPYTVRRYAREGVIPAYRVGRSYRFDPATLATWLAARLAHPASAVDVVDQVPALFSCGDGQRHPPHGECVGVPLPPARLTPPRQGRKATAR